MLGERLIRAADRGVRVRLLVDDNNLAGRDPIVAALDAHPNIEVRIFNPFAHRKSHALDFAVSFSRVNHRMHNKILIADSALAIVGDRNIGDDYFGLSPEADFRDLDALRTSVQERIAAHPYPYPVDEEIAALKGRLGELISRLTWAPGEVLADDPRELTSGERGDLGTALAERMKAAEREILIESAYFVQRKPAVEAARRVCDGGVRIRVLTNSLASNDVVPAHAGYEKHRKELLEAGVELNELGPDAAVVLEQLAPEAAGAIASLHTKAVVFDRESVFIGSFNRDPRSADLNTEVGLLIQSPELAAETAAIFDEAVAPGSSFRVQLDGHDDLVWITEVDGQETRWTHEPDTSGWQRLVADVVKLFPIQSQL